MKKRRWSELAVALGVASLGAMGCPFVPLFGFAGSGACLNDEECDNGLYCDGEEYCSYDETIGTDRRFSFGDPCAGAISECNEETDSCD